MCPTVTYRRKDSFSIHFMHENNTLVWPSCKQPSAVVRLNNIHSPYTVNEVPIHPSLTAALLIGAELGCWCWNSGNHHWCMCAVCRESVWKNRHDSPLVLIEDWSIPYPISFVTIIKIIKIFQSLKTDMNWATRCSYTLALADLCYAKCSIFILLSTLAVACLEGHPYWICWYQIVTSNHQR